MLTYDTYLCTLFDDLLYICKQYDLRLLKLKTVENRINNSNNFEEISIQLAKPVI